MTTMIEEPMSMSNNHNELILDFPQQHQHRRRYASSSPSFTTTETKKMKKSVSFSELSMMAIITNNLSYASKSDLWYTQNDIMSFRLDCAHMIHELKQSSKLRLPNSTDIMGLEGYLFNSSVGPMQRRREVRVAVLLEQHRQRRSGMHDKDLHILLARASQSASKLCRKRAEVIGLIHAHDYNCKI
jgi:hypothetical protein